MMDLREAKIDGIPATDPLAFPEAALRATQRHSHRVPRGLGPWLQRLREAAQAYGEAAEDVAALLTVEGVAGVEGVPLVECEIIP
jgi:hypothetical protein